MFNQQTSPLNPPRSPAISAVIQLPSAPFGSLRVPGAERLLAPGQLRQLAPPPVLQLKNWRRARGGSMDGDKMVISRRKIWRFHGEKNMVISWGKPGDLHLDFNTPWMGSFWGTMTTGRISTHGVSGEGSVPEKKRWQWIPSGRNHGAGIYGCLVVGPPL